MSFQLKQFDKNKNLIVRFKGKGTSNTYFSKFNNCLNINSTSTIYKWVFKEYKILITCWDVDAFVKKTSLQTCRPQIVHY